MTEQECIKWVQENLPFLMKSKKGKLQYPFKAAYFAREIERHLGEELYKLLSEQQETDLKDEKYEPYFGWCDVSGCKNEAGCGGTAWPETEYWRACYKHSASHRNGDPQPKMKLSAIKREKSRDKITRCLPSNTK